MVGRTNKILIDNWVEANGPSGVEKLVARSDVSLRTIAALRSGELRYPKKYSTRRKLCDALGVTHEQLFPGVDYPKTAVAS